MKKLWLILIIFMTVSCSSIQTDNFTSLLDTANNAAKTINSVLDENYDLTNRILEEEIILNDRELYNIFLERNAAYSIHPEQNTSMLKAIALSRHAINNINTLAINYFGLLVTLSGSEIVDKNNFMELAKGINDASDEVIKDLELSMPDAIMPTLTVSGAEITRLLMERRRKELLAEILKDNQPVIEAYSIQSIKIIDKIELMLYHNYSQLFAQIEEELFNEKNANHRREIADRAFDLNKEYKRNLEALKLVHKIYETIPGIHASLKEFKYNRNMRDFIQYGKSLEKIYNEVN